jgi:hypothetical protein
VALSDNVADWWDCLVHGHQVVFLRSGKHR